MDSAFVPLTGARMGKVTEAGPPSGVDAPLALDAIVADLRGVREQWRRSQKRLQEIGGRELPSREVLGKIVRQLCGALFPMRLGPPDLRQENEDYYVGQTLDISLGALLAQVRLEYRHHARLTGDNELVDIDRRSYEVVRQFGMA